MKYKWFINIWNVKEKVLYFRGIRGMYIKVILRFYFYLWLFLRKKVIRNIGEYLERKRVVGCSSC